MPEVALVAILDADKEGFLRSHRSLIQTIGRAARHLEGKAILYADKITQSMAKAIAETERRRDKQQKFNAKHQLRPQAVQRTIRDLTTIGAVSQEIGTAQQRSQFVEGAVEYHASDAELLQEIAQMEASMLEHANNLEFSKRRLCVISASSSRSLITPRLSCRVVSFLRAVND